MEKQRVKDVLEQAADSVVDLPKHLQEKALELAVGLLSGRAPSAPTPAPTPASGRERHAHDHRDGHGRDHPSVSDLLKHCKRNPDRYVVFFHELENRNEEATLDVLEGIFPTYKQDKPGNIVRDLANMQASDIIAKTSKEYGAPWTLKRKGRDRYVEIVAAANAGKK
jgi:hypothetical protein